MGGEATEGDLKRVKYRKITHTRQQFSDHSMTHLAARDGLFQTALPLERLQPDGVPAAFQMAGYDLQPLAVRAGVVRRLAARLCRLKVLAQLQHCRHDLRVRLDVLLQNLRTETQSPRQTLRTETQMGQSQLMLFLLQNQPETSLR